LIHRKRFTGFLKIKSNIVYAVLRQHWMQRIRLSVGIKKAKQGAKQHIMQTP